jgi:hypothetical protein
MPCSVRLTGAVPNNDEVSGIETLWRGGNCPRALGVCSGFAAGHTRREMRDDSLAVAVATIAPRHYLAC